LRITFIEKQSFKPDRWKRRNKSRGKRRKSNLQRRKESRSLSGRRGVLVERGGLNRTNVKKK